MKKEIHCVLAKNWIRVSCIKEAMLSTIAPVLTHPNMYRLIDTKRHSLKLILIIPNPVHTPTTASNNCSLFELIAFQRKKEIIASLCCIALLLWFFFIYQQSYCYALFFREKLFFLPLCRYGKCFICMVNNVTDFLLCRLQGWLIFFSF